MIRGREDIYFPFARTMRTERSIKFYLLFNATTQKIEAFTKQAIAQERSDGCDIRGFNGVASNIGPIALFSPIPEMGVPQNKEYCVAYKKILNRDSFYLETIDLTGKKKIYSKEEAIAYIEAGNIMLGVKIRDEKTRERLLVSHELLVDYPLQSNKLHISNKARTAKKAVSIDTIEDEDIHRG